MAALRASVITDIHLGPDSGGRLGSKAPRLMEAFLKAVGFYKPNIAIDMGDGVTSYSADEARDNARQLTNYFNRLAMPVFRLIGNHDVRHITRDEYAALSGIPAKSYSRDVNGYHLIFWNPGGDHDIHLEESDIGWLNADLAAADKPTIVFSHVPLDLQQTDFNEQADRDRSGRFYYARSAEIRAMLEKSGKVILCMAGHRHRNKHSEINGIHYIQQQSLTQKWKDYYKVPARTWSWLELNGDDIKVKVYGHGRRREYNLTARPVL